MAIQFEVGRTYACRSLCDYECIFRFTVVARTEKTVTIRGNNGTHRRKVRVYDDSERVDPHGRYSMSPILIATDKSGV